MNPLFQGPTGVTGPKGARGAQGAPVSIIFFFNFQSVLHKVPPNADASYMEHAALFC